MPDYIDASALAAIMLKEPSSGAVDDLVRVRSDTLFVSDFCLAECTSALATFARRKNWSRSQTDGLWPELDGWVAVTAQSVPTEAEDVTQAISIVRRFDLKLRAPDAIHVATAARLEARLITLDRRMARAAKALGLACINPAETLGEQKD